MIAPAVTFGMETASHSSVPLRQNDKWVESWAELMDELYANSWDPGIERFRSPYAFRGVPDATYDLSTSLTRLGTSARDLRLLEGHLLRNFRKYAHQSAAGSNSLWSWLALAQHHGLPTRLLDWTYSPLVALHFLTSDLRYAHVDGAVWCVDHGKTNRRIPRQMRRIAIQEGTTVFTFEMMDRTAGTLAEFDGLAEEPFVVFLEPPSLDARIVNQYALFSLMSSPSAQLHTWLQGRPKLYRRVIIPAALKWEVRDKLDQSNITERMLFPSLDGLTRWLTRYYSPKERLSMPQEGSAMRLTEPVQAGEPTS